MEKKHIITIAGKPGSGKSTTANRIAELLNYGRYSSGDFMREIARKRGLTIDQINKVAETDLSIDEEIDGSLKALNNKDDLVIDSRLAFHWIPDSFKVYLELDLNESARRIFTDTNERRIESGERAATIEEIESRIKERLESEILRYRERYGINPNDLNAFDLVLNTADSTPNSVADKVIVAYHIWLEGKSKK